MNHDGGGGGIFHSELESFAFLWHAHLFLPRLVASEGDGGVISGESNGGVISCESGGGVISGESDGMISGESDDGVICSESDGGVICSESDAGVICSKSDGVVISEQHQPEGREPLPDAGRLSALCHGSRQARRPGCLEGHLRCWI